MADIEKMKENLYRSRVEIDHKMFAEEILNIDFDGNISRCSIAMGMNPSHLHDIIYHGAKAGKVTLTRVLRYCLMTGRDPLRYITKII